MLTATDGYCVVFDEAVPSTVFSGGWDMMRVTSRGLADSEGIVATKISGWGLRVILR